MEREKTLHVYRYSFDCHAENNCGRRALLIGFVVDSSKKARKIYLVLFFVSFAAQVKYSKTSMRKKLELKLKYLLRIEMFLATLR